MGDLVDESVKRDLTTKGHTLWGRYPSSLFVSSLPSLYPNMICLSCGLVLHGFILLVTQYCHGLSPGQQHEKSLGEPPRFGLGVCRTQTCEKTSVAIERGEQYLNALTQSSRQESLIDLLWGNACHTNALSKVSKDCRDLNIAEKSRLALMLMYCQLVVQGESRSNPRLQCHAEEALKFCVNRLTDRENALYIEMISNIDTICLYIQNQEFEKYAEHMLNVLMKGSSTAAQSIKGIQRDLNILRSDILHQRKLQEHLIMNTSSNLLVIQQTFAVLQTRLHSLMQDVSNSFDQIKHEAHEVAAFQKEIKRDITMTIMYTENIFASIQEYQRKTDRTLSKILGSSYSKSDFLFYGSCVLSVLIMSGSGISLEKRFLFIVWFGSSLILERMLLSQYGAPTGWLDYIPQIKSYIRRTLAVLILLLSWTKHRYTNKLRVRVDTINKEATTIPCVFLHSQRSLGVRAMHVRPPYPRQAFSEIVLPAKSMLVEEDEIQSTRIGRRRA